MLVFLESVALQKKMQKTGLAIIGGGNLGQAIANGLLRSESLPYTLHISKRNTASLNHLREQGVEVYDSNPALLAQASLILIAVKPYDVPTVLLQIKEHLDPEKHTIISLASSVSIKTIQEYVGTNIPVFRAMPNTAADIAEAVTCISAVDGNGQSQKEVEKLFSLLGEVLIIKEELMEAATVLGACGIAYVLRFMRSMVQGGIQIGFDAKTATAIVNQVVKGAAELLIERKAHPEAEIDKVTTPKGCTIIGLNEMEHHGFSSALIKGISTSYMGIMN